MKHYRLILGLSTLALTSMMGFALAADGDAPEPKHTIKEVMIKGHKDGLLKKVLGGEASQADKLMLLDLYISMVESPPPKGDMESWHQLAGASALAAAKVATGRDALAELKQATNCAACHKAHKPPKE